MEESKRLEELREYDVLKNISDEVLDEIVEIAAGICDTPIAAITLVDKNMQRHIAKLGINKDSVPLKQSYCRYNLSTPEDLLVITNPMNDSRYTLEPIYHDNVLVQFYAGAPLVTDSNNVLGSLCIVDTKIHELTDQKVKSLKLLAKRTVMHLKNLKEKYYQEREMALNAKRLIKLTENAPGMIFQLKMKENEKPLFEFISKGSEDIHPSIFRVSNGQPIQPEAIFDDMHQEDKPYVQEAWNTALMNGKDLRMEYRTYDSNGQTRNNYLKVQADVKDGESRWYGIITDVTEKKSYARALEKMIHDISHVMRRPIASMLGLIPMIKYPNQNEKNLSEIAQHMENVFLELDEYSKKMSSDYHSLKTNFALNEEWINNYQTTAQVSSSG